jgi:two-component system, sensor histidine kinase and response regulator
MNTPRTESIAKLLIVDDEVAQMTALCHTLQDEGYTTIGFSSSRAALTAMRDQEFDILLTDLMMPSIDGIALLSAAQEIDPDLVCVVMTGHGAVETAVRAMQAGALDYIQKPFKLKQMLPVLNRAMTIRRLRRSNAELERRVRQHTVKLEAANQELEAFSYSVSHDLRAPLRAIIGYADLLDADHSKQLEGEAQQAVDGILTAGNRMSELIRDLLDLAHLSRQQLHMTRIHTIKLVKEVLIDLQHEYASRQLDIRIGDLPECDGDESLIRQVFVNLLSNAFKFTSHRQDPVIEIAGKQQGDEAIYSVRDNGAGFDMTHADKLFGVFQRLHSNNEFEGTGIGLSIVQRIVGKHGGRAWAEGAVDNGATFYFSLPAAC